MAGVITADFTNVISGLQQLRDNLTQFREQFIDDVSTALDSALQDGEQAMHQRVQAAETTTGAKRAAADGGLPGRIVTGEMDDGISHSIETEGTDTVIGTLGWISGGPAYTDFQEYGTGDNLNEDLSDPSFGSSAPGAGIPHMHALVDGFLVAKESVTKIMDDLDGKVFKL